MEKLKQQLVEVEKQREEHGDTIGKLKQVIALYQRYISFLQCPKTANFNSDPLTRFCLRDQMWFNTPL